LYINTILNIYQHEKGITPNVMVFISPNNSST